MVENKIQKLIKEEVFQAMRNAIENGSAEFVLECPTEEVADDLLDRDADLEGSDRETVMKFVELFRDLNAADQYDADSTTQEEVQS